MYVVTGATGNTGSVVAQTLLSRGKSVRVLGRDRGRLERFTRQGAEGVAIDRTTPEALTQAFSGGEAAYLMIPPNINAPDVRAYQDALGDALAVAMEKTACNTLSC